MAAAREAAEREAQALRVEAEALREAHDRALSETARLREANRDLMEDLGEADDPRSSARDAARRLRAERTPSTRRRRRWPRRWRQSASRG